MYIDEILKKIVNWKYIIKIKIFNFSGKGGGGYIREDLFIIYLVVNFYLNLIFIINLLFILRNERCCL